MVILGGLEILAGGYLVHRYHRSKSEKKRLEQEAQQRRYNSFPGARPQPCYQSSPQQPMPQQHKYGYVANAPLDPPRPPPPHRPYTEPPPHRPHNAPHAPHVHRPQPFMIPRRPLPKKQHVLPQMIQPLQRADSMATISRMPIANGYRPGRVAGESQFTPYRQDSQLSPIAQSPASSPYGNPGFALSSPAFTSDPTAQTHYSTLYGGRQTVDDNGETYNNQSRASGHYAPSLSTALGEVRDDDPPPPYRP